MDLVGIVGDVRGDRLAVLDEPADHIGEVLLALGVVARQMFEALAQGRRREQVEPTVDLVDRELGLTGVLVLDDATHLIALPHDAPVPGWVIQPRREDGRGRTRGGVLLRQTTQRCAGQQGRVAGQDHHGACTLGHQRHGVAHGVPRPTHLVLDRCARRRRGDLQVLSDLLPLMPDDHNHVVDVRFAQGP